MATILLLTILLLTLWIITLYRKIATLKSKMVNMKESRRMEFQEFFRKLNHEGPIPHGVSAIGLMTVTLLGVSRAIAFFLMRFNARDWNTKEGIIELQEIVIVELTLLRGKIEDFVESWRQHLKDYDHNQDY